MERTEKSFITVERAAYGAVALLAALLRWFGLGLQPLGENEAVQALAAYRFIHGTAASAPAGTLPALFTGNVLGFTLLGSGDPAARWLPALAGVILVLLPYGLRHQLGRGGALAASLLLAISPSALYFSRTLDGSMLVAVSGLALAVGTIQTIETHRSGALFLAAGALGLGLCAGSTFYTLLAVFAAFAAVLYLAERAQRREGGWSAVRAAWQTLRQEKGLTLSAAGVGAAVFGLASTAFLLHPAGLGHTADLIGNWVQGFAPELGGQPAVYPLLILLRYEPLVLVLGLVEGGWGVFLACKHRRRKLETQRAGDPVPGFPHTLFLAFWALAACLIVVIAGHRPAGNVLLAVVPLALLTGQSIERAWRWLSDRSLWPVAGLAAAVALGLGVFFYLQVAAYALSSDAATVSFAGISLYTGTAYLLLALLAVLLLVGLGAVAWIWRGPEVVVGGGWLALLVALGLWTFKSAWGLSFAHAADPRELMIGQTTAPDVQELVRQLQRLSLDEAGDAATLPVTIDTTTGPVVAWYLREFSQQQLVEQLTGPPDTPAAVTLVRRDLPIGETFRGRGFPLRAHWQPWGLGPRQFVRWLLFGAASQPTVDQEVVLWVSSQQGGQ